MEVGPSHRTTASLNFSGEVLCRCSFSSLRSCQLQAALRAGLMSGPDINALNCNLVKQAFTAAVMGCTPAYNDPKFKSQKAP